MVDWSSPGEIAKDTTIFNSVLHAVVGAYLWEFLLSFDLEIVYLTGRKKFRWPMLFYFGARYFMLGACIASLVRGNDTADPRLGCAALFRFIVFSGNYAVSFSTLSLSMRAIAVWDKSWYVIGLISVLAVGQWVIIFTMMTQVSGQFVEGQGCAGVTAGTRVVVAMFVYTMVFDLVILLLVSLKLGFPRSATPLVNMLFRDGLVYFMVAVVANLIAVVFIILDLNFPMSVIFQTPAAVFGTTAACRAVRRLSNYFGDEDNARASNGNIQHRQSVVFNLGGTRTATTNHTTNAGVSETTVQMATFGEPMRNSSPVEYEDDGDGERSKARPLELHSPYHEP